MTTQKIELQINASIQLSTVENEQKNEESQPLKTKSFIPLNNDDNVIIGRHQQTEEEKNQQYAASNSHNIDNLKHVTYKLNESKNEIIVDELSEEYVTNDNTCTSNICLYCKYRKEFITQHRKQRNNVILFPIYAIFITFCYFAGFLISNEINKQTTHTNGITHTNAKFRHYISQSELDIIQNCDIEFDDIYGWFDALSFDFMQTEWIDYSVYKNHINSSYISGNIKLGLLKNKQNETDNVYIYGSKTDSIKMHPLLGLNKNNYTIITIARYNGNDRNTIFISNDSKWIMGFENNKIDIVYHDGFKLNPSLNYSAGNYSLKFNDGWVINIDSPNIFKSQQQTMYNNTKNDTNDNVIVWGVNIFNDSDWAVQTVLLFKYQLSFAQIECVENYLVNKYHLLSNDGSNDDIYNVQVKTPKIYECDRWQEGFDSEYIVSWYDVNIGFDNNTLFDLSKNSHDILLNNHMIGIDEISGSFNYLYGSLNYSISIPISIDMNNTLWTAIYYVARYNGNDKGSILVDVSRAFRCGFYQGNAGVCYLGNNQISEFKTNVYEEQWVLSSFKQTNFAPNVAYYCTQNCETSSRRYDIVHGELNLTINGEHNSEWAFTEIIIVQIPENELYFIPFIDTMCIEEYLSNKYNINSYKYNIKSAISFFGLNILYVIFLMIGAIWFAHKYFKDVRTQIFQGCKITFDVCTQIFQGCHIFWYFNCRTSCGCMNCWGSLRGILMTHFCACQTSLLPFYNTISAIYSLVSILKTLINSKKEIFFYLLLSGFVICVAAATHFIFTYQYIIGYVQTFDELFYVIEFQMCIFLWSIVVVDSIRNYVNDFYWFIIVATYLYLTFVLWTTSQLGTRDMTDWSSKYSIYVLSGIQLVFVFIVWVFYYLQCFMSFPRLLQSILLIILIIIVTVDKLNNVYKIWVFSFTLVHYINLHASEWVQSKTRKSKECSTLHSKGKLFSLKLHSNKENYAMLLLHLDTCCRQNQLIVQSKINTSTVFTNYISLNHEYESNAKYTFDESLLNIIRNDAKYYESTEQNKYFDFDQIRAILIFLKFPSFRFFLNEYLLNQQITGFFHFYRTLCVANDSLDIPTERKTGFTILNSKISSTAPIIFCQNIDKLFKFSVITNSKYQGAIFKVTISGKFVPICFFGETFLDMFMVIIPNSIQMISQNAKQQAIQYRETIQLDEIIERGNIINLRQNLSNTKHLITVQLLTNLLMLYRKNDAEESDIKWLSNYVINLKDLNILTQMLFRIQTIKLNMKEIFCLIWLKFINSNIDKMSIIKLRHKYKQKQISEVGKRLLEYASNNILNKLPRDIKLIEWQKYIEQYVYNNLLKDKTEILLNELETQMTTTPEIQTFLRIMHLYESIFDEQNNETELELTYNQKTATSSVQNVFDAINKECNMSELMDTFLDLQDGNIEYKNKIKNDNQCKFQHECKILDSVFKTRKYGLRSRIPNPIQQKNVYFDTKLSLEECCMLDVLDFMHIRLFHKEEHYRNTLPNRAGIGKSFETTMDGINLFFKDTVDTDNNLISLALFCEQNAYDSEAIYDDIFPDQDGQSNIYWFFQHNMKDKMKEYEFLKNKLSNYTINPPNKKTIERNLIDLDFGQHVTDWNVNIKDSKFVNMKEEWMKNEFFIIDENIYQSLKIKSTTLANLDYNKNRYKLSVDDVLCLKVYTDTDKLQANFRHAFRCSADKNRRCQFIHWAVNLSVIFIQIEALNEAYNYNNAICNYTLYHGLNRLFNTRGLGGQFYGVLSTTWEKSIAGQFAGGRGMILQIHKEINVQNTNAISVHWISCHPEQEILLMNPQVIIQQSFVFSNDISMKSSYLKRTLSSVSSNVEDTMIFEKLSAFIQSQWMQHVYMKQ
eukprot:514557_1